MIFTAFADDDDIPGVTCGLEAAKYVNTHIAFTAVKIDNFQMKKCDIYLVFA